MSTCASLSSGLSLSCLRAALRSSWSRETTYWRERWSTEHPSVGQCAVTALIVQEALGGDIAEGVLPSGELHYWNLRNRETIIDLTVDQFFDGEKAVFRRIITRDELLRNPNTKERYSILRRAVSNNLPNT